MAVLVVDYSRPWSVMERLEHWVEVLDKHIESMKVGYGMYRSSVVLFLSLIRQPRPFLKLNTYFENAILFGSQ